MAGRRRGRGVARAAAFASRTPTPAVKQDASDEEMADAGDVDASEVASPQPDDGEAEDAASPADDADAQPDDDDGASSPPIVPLPRKRRGPGRPPRNPRPEHTPDPDDASESGTPFRRRRGRPSGGFRGGFRGRPKYGPKTQPDRVPIDKEGNTVDVVNDEADLPEDPEGETKVDKNGQLQGGRDYRVRVFTIKGRQDRLYMLSTEPARCTGFRDSYLFFTKHLSLYKVILGDAEKLDLIERDIIPHSYKGRSIGVVTARSVFREFGARIVIAGRRIVDDYRAQDARLRGDVEGEPADPNDRLPPPGEEYNKNQYVAWHGASQVYHNTAPSMPIQTGKPVTGKRKMNVTATNWQYEHAREASKFNTTLTALRRANLSGVYDTHTNLLLHPKIMQPTHIEWTELPTPSEHLVSQNKKRAIAHPTLNSDPNPASAPETITSTSTIFPTPSALIKRNYLVTDTYFRSPSLPTSGLIPGPDGDALDLGINGLSGVKQELIDQLPADCKTAFLQEREREAEWKGRWGTEGRDGMRGALRIGFNGFPV